MGYKLLQEYLYFDKNKSDYSEAEKEKIRKGFEKTLKEKTLNFTVI